MMRRSAASFVLAPAILVASLGFATSALANDMDLSLARFIECTSPTTCAPQISAYEQFLAEYSFGLAPKILAPAETLGYSGFYLGLEGSLTTVPGKTDRWFKGTVDENASDEVMFVPALHVRKGLPWSFEMGGTINYLARSELVALGGDIKWSLFEGYRNGWRGFLPDVAVRGSVVRVLGESDADITIVGVDGSVSKNFGIGGMVVLVPYVGFQYLWTFVRVEPLIYRDDTGHSNWGSLNDQFHAPQGNTWDTTGLSGPNLERMKLFFGLRFQYEVLVFTAELGWGMSSEWNTALDKAASDSRAYDEQKTAKVGDQIQVSLAVGTEF
jgi:hypothetical protein